MPETNTPQPSPAAAPLTPEACAVRVLTRCAPYSRQAVLDLFPTFTADEQAAFVTLEARRCAGEAIGQDVVNLRCRIADRQTAEAAAAMAAREAEAQGAEPVSPETEAKPLTTAQRKAAKKAEAEAPR